MKKTAGFSNFLIILLCAVPALADQDGWLSGLSEKFGKELIDLVDISVTHSAANCSADYPLLVEIENNSRRDITDVGLIAFARDPNYSRAECAEYFDLKDLVIKARQTHSSCWSTLETRGVYLLGRRLSIDEINDSFELSPIEFADKYGAEAANNTFILGELASEHWRLTSDINPKQALGCLETAGNLAWFARINRIQQFEAP